MRNTQKCILKESKCRYRASLGDLRKINVIFMLFYYIFSFSILFWFLSVTPNHKGLSVLPSSVLLTYKDHKCMPRYPETEPFDPFTRTKSRPLALFPCRGIKAPLSHWNYIEYMNIRNTINAANVIARDHPMYYNYVIIILYRNYP